ncbi:MAG: nitrous oxide reductase accessory protein NosL [Pelovirga sp.]
MRRLLQKILIVGFLLAFSGSTATAFEPQMPGPRDRCPVCGMFVAKYPEWIATIVLNDGQQLFFDGAKDMFRYYFSLPEGQVTRDDIHSIYVTEYYSARYTPVDEVLFVLGSDVYGPMGAELIPVRGRQHAQTFMKDYSGKRIVTFAEVTPDMLPPDYR